MTDYQVGYRHVVRPEYEWFTAGILRLSPAIAGVDNQARIRELLKQRNATQPLGLPSCGSVFRNPPNDYAARLIEQLGWKGRSIGGAQVSEKHANFIINTGGATATEVETLIEQIQRSVEQATGIRLIPEVHIVGENK